MATSESVVTRRGDKGLTPTQTWIPAFRRSEGPVEYADAVPPVIYSHAVRFRFETRWTTFGEMNSGKMQTYNNSMTSATRDLLDLGGNVGTFHEIDKSFGSTIERELLLGGSGIDHNNSHTHRRGVLDSHRSAAKITSA